ncbi:uncharacterized protein F5Z01DRAFT_643811 [Emericellopsis atlantica]|uniref:Uncharacterized protein n=1 Tax=Emericellopsis atlantica TaxID=2614577 RepID=A0A9P7ZVT2_9HYPO|nr:uncharacterized protein F5Z01DRAFT_643811 [Emericellopsis atlantica]KAG9258647.1 hypothetical protein F5Z01DRAFT_643811 [Emericellopsis atlantica]
MPLGAFSVAGRMLLSYAFCRFSLCFLMPMAIMRQVRFSMRSWFGSCCFVLAKNFHTWVASGSSCCMPSTSLTLALCSRGNKAGPRMASSCGAAVPFVWAPRSRWCAAPGWAAGRRGKRQSCSVDVGFIVKAGLAVPVIAAGLAAAIVSTRGQVEDEL